MKFTVIKKEGTARRGVFETVHGTVQTPAFMNVATCGAIKGRAYTHGQRRIPGLFARKAPQDKRGGCLFFLAYRRTQDFYGPRGEYENTVEPRLDYRHGL